MPRPNRQSRRERGQARFDVAGDAIAETVGGIVYRLRESTTGTVETQVVVFLVPGVSLVDAAGELRILASELEQLALGLT